jgi:hypothetical protein
MKLPATANAVILCLIGCWQPKRPLPVGMEAVRVEGAKTAYWQVCSLGQNNAIHCTVWNDGGTVLKDETYLPLDEGQRRT